jgi:hypothetical protein
VTAQEDVQEKEDHHTTAATAAAEVKEVAATAFVAS